MTLEAPILRIGLDAEALSGPEWFDSAKTQTRLAVCFGYGTLHALEYVEARDMTPGVFYPSDLETVLETLSTPGVVVVAHNAKYDLELLNGTLLDHDLPMLPEIRYIDTMNTLKTGRAFRNTLSARCAAMGVRLKQGTPDWRAVLQRTPEAWDVMQEYNLNDVVCTLELEQAYTQRSIPCPIKTWYPRH